MINNVTLVGRLSRDPELRYTKSNTAVATFNLAVTRRFKNATGERETDFINCVIWRHFAENLASWAKKGDLVGVVGSIQTRNYENQEGRRVYVTEILVESFQMLESRMARERHSQSGEVDTAPVPQASTPSALSVTADFEDPFADRQPVEVSDDDLPF